MNVYTGTSGWAYKEWRGAFYPDDIREPDMLAYYAERLRSVELNNTFYRLPNEQRLAEWRAQVPDGFRFALKASRVITHMKRLKDAGDATTYLFSVTSHLGDALGPILFGLPPNLKCDLERLDRFLPLVPEGARAAFEFRNPGWHTEEVYARLRERGLAVCLGDDEDRTDPWVATADWGYLRLRRVAYTEDDLRMWRQRVDDAGWSDAFVYFKHEDAATGPRLAAEFAAL